MSKPDINPNKTISGIAVDPKTLERVIPESRRADGSVRKQLRIRPGFTPQEDVKLFRSARQQQAEQSKANRTAGHIPGWAPPGSRTVLGAGARTGTDASGGVGTVAGAGADGSKSKNAAKKAKQKAKKQADKQAALDKAIAENWEDSSEEEGTKVDTKSKITEKKDESKGGEGVGEGVEKSGEKASSGSGSTNTTATTTTTTAEVPPISNDNEGEALANELNDKLQVN